MKFRTINFDASASVKADVMLVGCYENETHSVLGPVLGTECGGVALRQAQALDFSGKVGETFVHFPDGKIGARLVVVFGLGLVNGGSAGMRKAYAAAFKKAKELKATTVAVAP